MFGEKHVVVHVRAERRVEVHEVHRRILDVAPENIEVVAVVEDVLIHRYAPIDVRQGITPRTWPACSATGAYASGETAARQLTSM